MSQNGGLGSEPARPVFVAHIPKGGDRPAKLKMLERIDAAVRDAYRLPDPASGSSVPVGSHGDFAIFLHEHTLETVAINGKLLATDEQRVEDQNEAYSAASRG